MFQTESSQSKFELNVVLLLSSMELGDSHAEGLTPHQTTHS